MAKRRKTRTVNVGKIRMGSGHPVVIQSMAKTETSDVDATTAQINQLEKAGCELVRVAVKKQEDASAIFSIKKNISIPLVADIHFDHKLALKAIENGADKIRVNPGNITRFEDIEKIIDAAKKKKIPIRVGVNSGSLPGKDQSPGDIAESMVEAALGYLRHFAKKDFTDIVISLKASDVATTVEAYRKISDKCDHPLHLGVTAAGLPEKGTVKSSIGIGTLLLDGIGDTVRVSLTGDPMDEISVAKNILSAAGARKLGPGIIACPTCGRCQVDLVAIVKDLEKKLEDLTKLRPQAPGKQIVIAVMGCEVNGPGEAKHADIGIAFGKGTGSIFRHGEIIKTVKEDSAIGELLDIIGKEL